MPEAGYNTKKQWTGARKASVRLAEVYIKRSTWRSSTVFSCFSSAACNKRDQLRKVNLLSMQVQNYWLQWKVSRKERMKVQKFLNTSVLRK